MTKKHTYTYILYTFINEMSGPTQIDDMMTPTITTNIRGNLRGSSSPQSAAAAYK